MAPFYVDDLPVFFEDFAVNVTIDGDLEIRALVDHPIVNGAFLDAAPDQQHSITCKTSDVTGVQAGQTVEIEDNGTFRVDYLYHDGTGLTTIYLKP